MAGTILNLPFTSRAASGLNHRGAFPLIEMSLLMRKEISNLIDYK